MQEATGTNTIYHEDCCQWMKKQPDNSVNLTVGSPPYENARTYGIDFNLSGQEWVDWMVERVVEMVRITDGMVAMVVQGKTQNFSWSGTPMLLGADLMRMGITMRVPVIFGRQGIPGSGGKDGLRGDYEFVLCFTSGGKLPWSDNKAMGWPCKYKTGGAMSNRTKSGQRKNAKTGKKIVGNNGRPNITNPGNLLWGNVGKGHMGNDLAHENEAPFPEWLAEFFVRSFCPPDGIVYDPFIGSGTTAAVAIQHGRRYVGTDVRQSQVELANRRIDQARKQQESC